MMKATLERFLRQAQLSPRLRVVANRYGRAYWRLPRKLRRRICWESKLRTLKGVETTATGQPEILEPLRESRAAGRELPTFGHRLVAQGGRTAAPVVARISKTWLVGEFATPVTPNGRVILSPFRDAPRLFGLERRLDLETWLDGRGWRDASGPAELTEVWSMVNRLQTNYYHWIVEWCGRLESLETYGRETGRTWRLLIPRESPGYVRASLEALGCGPERLLEWPADSPPRRVDHLLLPSFPGTLASPSARSLGWLRARFLQAAGVHGAAAGRRIYLPRRPGTWRAVRNSQEVEEFLSRSGFEIVDPQRLSFLEQVRMFSEARLVVGLHGAAMTNVLFAPRASVLELFGRYGDGVYFGITRRLGQRYEAMRCREVRHQDVIVDLLELGRRVEALSRP